MAKQKRKQSPLRWATKIGISIAAIAGIWVGFPYAYVSYTAYVGLDETVFMGHAFSADGSLVIGMDPGGIALDRTAYARILTRQKIDIKVLGMCASSCTRYLSVPNVCSAPDALWLFHKGYFVGKDNENLNPMHKFMLDNFARASYVDMPPLIGDWMLEITDVMGPDDQYVVAGQELIDKGWVKTCAEPGLFRGVESARQSAEVMSAGYEILRPMPFNVPQVDF